MYSIYSLTRFGWRLVPPNFPEIKPGTMHLFYDFTTVWCLATTTIYFCCMLVSSRLLMYTWSTAESLPYSLASQPRSQAAVKGNVTHQQQQCDISVEKQEVKLSMCYVNLEITLTPWLNEEEGKPGNEAAQFQNLSLFRWLVLSLSLLTCWNL